MGSRVEDGLLANDVAARVKPRLEEMVESLPGSYFLEQGGEQRYRRRAPPALTGFSLSGLALFAGSIVVGWNDLEANKRTMVLTHDLGGGLNLVDY